MCRNFLSDFGSEAEQAKFKLELVEFHKDYPSVRVTPAFIDQFVNKLESGATWTSVFRMSVGILLSEADWIGSTMVPIWKKFENELMAIINRILEARPDLSKSSYIKECRLIIGNMVTEKKGLQKNRSSSALFKESEDNKVDIDLTEENTGSVNFEVHLFEKDFERDTSTKTHELHISDSDEDNELDYGSD